MAADGLSITGLHKSFDANEVLKGIEVTFAFGEVHALLGANGAGKSTLLGCLSGAVQPDRAEIRLAGEVHPALTPRRAFDAGIAIIYQHFQLIGPLTVADNIFLGRELRGRGGTVDRARQEAEAREVLVELGLELDTASRVETLSVGAQQMVEIARAVRLRPRVLILDEPTAALGAHEVEALLALVGRLAARGIAVVYVTHLLAEVLEVADRATVLRDGRVLWTRERGELTMPDLVQAISPDAVIGHRARAAAPEPSGEAVVGIDGFATGFTGPLTLDLRAGEIVGIFGLLGSGRTDLLEALAGVRGAVAGTVRVGGDPVTLGSPRAAQRAGIALVASDRKEQSLFGSMSALENMLMPHLGRLGRVVRRRGRESEVFAAMARSVGLVPASPVQAADGFSGGNAQKIVVARWTCGLGDTRFLLLDEPTQGVDIGARHDLYQLLRRWAAESGAAVLFATSDPEEVLALADRVVVLVEGRPVHSGSADLDESQLVAHAQPSTTERTVLT